MAAAKRPERVQVTFELDGDLFQIVNAMARAEDRSRARQLNVLLRKALADQLARTGSRGRRPQVSLAGGVA
jgi:hypothetical protein